MAHPFTKMFDTALRHSTPLDNRVLVEAEKLKDKGYSVDEIYTVLVKLQKSLIDKTESEIVAEAVEEFSRFVETFDEDED
jgi:hypothetical protein